jgi:hypothetical protein
MGPPDSRRGRPLDQESPPTDPTAASVTPSADNGHDRSPLRQALDNAIAEANGSKLSMKDLTVLAPQNDPFRIDTPANHRDSKWLADVIADLGIRGQIHLRGLHYAISMAPKPFTKPDGTRYVNDDRNWDWMSAVAMKAARWLGYIPWDSVFDKRNAEPTIYEFAEPDPWPFLSIGLDITVPSVDQIQPYVGLSGFRGVQPYKVVMIGEKSSLEDILLQVAQRRGADLYLPTGNISDSMVYKIAKNADDDGRPLIVQYFSDCDPSGWNMPIEVGRKLQAFKVALFPDLEFRQYRAGLTPDHVREYSLPEAPLKASEKRASDWRRLMGVEQTEIDALIQLRPDLLRQIAEDAIEPFYDRTLDRRCREAAERWRREAQQIVDDSLDDHLDQIRADAAAKLEELQAEIDAINDALRFDIGDFAVPLVPAVPEPVVSWDHPLPLLDSSWSFAEQCKALIDSKAYRIGGGS